MLGTAQASPASNSRVSGYMSIEIDAAVGSPLLVQSLQFVPAVPSLRVPNHTKHPTARSHKLELVTLPNRAPTPPGPISLLLEKLPEMARDPAQLDRSLEIVPGGGRQNHGHGDLMIYGVPPDAL